MRTMITEACNMFKRLISLRPNKFIGCKKTHRMRRRSLQHVVVFEAFCPIPRATPRTRRRNTLFCLRTMMPSAVNSNGALAPSHQAAFSSGDLSPTGRPLAAFSGGGLAERRRLQQAAVFARLRLRNDLAYQSHHSSDRAGPSGTRARKNVGSTTTAAVAARRKAQQDLAGTTTTVDDDTGGQSQQTSCEVLRATRDALRSRDNQGHDTLLRSP